MTLSQVLDDTAVSWCERIMLDTRPLSAAVAARADAVRCEVLSAELGGTWWGVPPPVGCSAAVFAAADPSVTWALVRRAVAAGAAGAAGETVLVLPRIGRVGVMARRLGVVVLTGTVDPWPLLRSSDRLYAARRSDAVLAAGLLGRTVEHEDGQRSPSVNPVRLAAAALLQGARYANPFTGAPSTPENYLDALRDMRRNQRTRSAVACCVGISFWKRRRVAAFVGAGRPAFRKTAVAAVRVAARRGGTVAVWPSRAPTGLAERAREAGVGVVRMEDGFVRSVGLGADFLPPLSLVLDRTGLYYDVTGPSDLETLLAEAAFEPALLDRAAALRQRIVADRVTKYNLSAEPPPVWPAGARVILVPGQVADDRSVLLGGAGVRPGLDLLHRVRRQVPEAFIVYKPHPDVEAGHRLGAVPDAAVLRVADRVLRDSAMADLLDRVDEVHTLTSLAGFEALLRGKPVTTYGQPFYAGWGLTTDLHPPPRRTRRLRLDELVAGALLLYPSYIDPVTLLPCGPETVLDRLRDPALHRAGWLVRARRLQGRLWRGVQDRLAQRRSPRKPAA